ncbi:MAG TPA: hypothetical protein PLB91_01250 [Spirochaetales bacterium]|nr:hypothetical protein [Spirochaetales bacterium]HRY54295.1 hypothetical protein [Spirochaetia bacterium]
MDGSLIKKPEDYGIYGTVLGRSLLPSEAHGNLDVLVGVLNSMLGALTPSAFGARYGDATKAWVPIGHEYVQRPGAPAAPDLYTGTWEYYGQAGSSLASRAGRVERAEGGNALSFGGGQQDDAIRNIEGNIVFQRAPGSWSANGVFAATGSVTTASGGSSTVYGAANFNASRVVPVAVENRMVNDTVRIWRKVA